MNALTIGAIARRAGVGVETIRFYERKGLVRRPPRPTTGFRVYPEDVVVRIGFIRQAQSLGFTLQEIAGLLALRVAPGTDCAAVRARAAVKLGKVEARLAEFTRIRAALVKLIAACPGRGAVTTCTILDTLAAPTRKPIQPRKARRTDMKSLALEIQGMHCEGCAGTIEALLTREPGVKAASISYAAGKGQILYDPVATDPARIEATIKQAGFRIGVDRAADRS